MRPSIPNSPQEKDRKKLLVILLIGAGVCGTLIFWLVSPMFELGGKKEDKMGSYYDELATGDQATDSEQAYLDGVNQPVETITDADADESSLSLIKREKLGEDKDKDKSERPRYRDRRSRRSNKVSNLDNARKKGNLKLSKLRGLDGGRGGGSGGSGYGVRDLDRWAGRFKKGSGYEGANVLTGPGAGAGGKKGTKFGAVGQRHLGDSKADEQLAKSMSNKFDGTGGSLGKAVNPKEALKDAAGSVPADLSSKLPSKDVGAPNAPRNEHRERQNQDDPCANVKPTSPGEAITNLLMGIGMVAAAYGFSSLGGGKETVSESHVFQGADGEPKIVKTQSEKDKPVNPIVDKLGGGLADSGIKQFMGGISGLAFPDKPVEDCKRGRAGVGGSAAGAGGGFGG